MEHIRSIVGRNAIEAQVSAQLADVPSELATGSAARLLGVSAEYLRRLAHSGRIRSLATIHGLVFRKDDLADHLIERKARRLSV